MGLTWYDAGMGIAVSVPSPLGTTPAAVSTNLSLRNGLRARGRGPAPSSNKLI